MLARNINECYLAEFVTHLNSTPALTIGIITPIISSEPRTETLLRPVGFDEIHR